MAKRTDTTRKGRMTKGRNTKGRNTKDRITKDIIPKGRITRRGRSKGKLKKNLAVGKINKKVECQTVELQRGE